MIPHADDHLSHPAPVLLATHQDRHLRSQNWGWTSDPAVRDRDATNPRIDGPAVLPLFCLAPHGVFRASRITPRAVSSYLAFSPLPALLSKNRRCLFCDTFRQRPLARTPPAYSTRHAAVWCSDFPPANLAIHQRSSAIDAYSSTFRSHCIRRTIRAMIRRFQPGQDGSRPPKVEGAMAMSFYCRRGKSTSNHAFLRQSFGCRLSDTFALVCRPAR